MIVGEVSFEPTDSPTSRSDGDGHVTVTLDDMPFRTGRDGLRGELSWWSLRDRCECTSGLRFDLHGRCA